MFQSPLLPSILSIPGICPATQPLSFIGSPEQTPSETPMKTRVAWVVVASIAICYALQYASSSNWRSQLERGVYAEHSANSLEGGERPKFTVEDGLSCYELAKRYPEPYTPEYYPTGGPVDLTGPQWSFYQHTGNITLEDVERVQESTPHKLLRVKVLGGKLFYRQRDMNVIKSVRHQSRARVFMSGVVMAMQWFDIPDMEFVYDERDYALGKGGPVFQHCANNATGTMIDGFVVPFPKSIDWALGPTQMKALNECLNRRYSASSRIPKVVWRGTTRPAAPELRREHFVRGPREEAIIASWNLTKYTDIKATRKKNGLASTCLAYQNFTEDGSCPEVSEPIPLEDYNKYAFVLDMDGNGWSSRLPLLLYQNTPIIKQASRYPDYLTQHLQNKDIIDYLETDMSNFEVKVKDLLSQRSAAPRDYHQEKLRKMHDFARVHLSHFGVARAMAFALSTFAQKTTWNPILNGDDVQFTLEELTIISLPSKFVQNLQARHTL